MVNMSIIYTVHCTLLYSVQCTEYRVHNRAETQWKVPGQNRTDPEPGEDSAQIPCHRSVQCPVCSVQCAVCGVQCAVCSVRCAVCSVQCAGSKVLATVCSVHCTLYSRLMLTRSEKEGGTFQLAPSGNEILKILLSGKFICRRAFQLSSCNCERKKSVNKYYTTFSLWSPTHSGAKISVFYKRFVMCKIFSLLFQVWLQRKSLSQKSSKIVCFWI